MSAARRFMGPRAQAAVLAALIAAVVLFTLIDAISHGLHSILPGSMSRNRDSIAVAITYVQFGRWDGYASYRRVNEALRERGLSVHNDELARIGAGHYFDVMLTPSRLEAALQAAITLPDPASDGLFYMQDEKGLALLYLLAFSMFGIAPASLFYLYMLLLALSLALAVVSFRDHPDVLLFFLVLACTHEAVMRILPEMPRQDITVIQSSRFVGVLGTVPMFHLMLLMLYRVRPSPLAIVAAAGQALVLMLVVNARTSAFWTVLALIVIGTGVWVSVARPWPQGVMLGAARLWPLVLVTVGVVGLWLHQQHGVNQFYNTPEGQIGRVFWHNVTTALATHPDRSAVLGIPPNMLAYDDQVGYLLFDREIERRGERRDAYVVADSDWGYRTTEARLDFRWSAYDAVLRDVVLRTFREHPRYVLESLFLYQPLAAARLIVSPGLLRWTYVLAPALVAAQLVGALVAGVRRARSIWLLMTAWAVGSAVALLPVIVAAVIELRVVEIFFMAMFGGALVICLGVSYASHALTRRILAHA